MLVEPGFFRTELLSNDSTTYAQPTVEGYAELTREIVSAWKRMDGKQGGDPAKLAEALVTLSGLKEPPARFAAGADAVQTFEAKAKMLLAQAQAHRDLSVSLAAPFWPRRTGITRPGARAPIRSMRPGAQGRTLPGRPGSRRPRH